MQQKIIFLSFLLGLCLPIDFFAQVQKVGSHTVKRSKQIRLEKATIKMTWASHDPERRSTSARQFPIHLRVAAPYEIRTDMVTIFLDGRRYTSNGKAGEVSLRRASRYTNIETTIKQSSSRMTSTVYVEVRGKNGKTIRSATIQIDHPSHQQKANLHILAIGPNHPDLMYTAKDAQDFANIFRNQNALWNRVNVLPVLAGNDATTFGIIGELKGIKESYELDKTIKPEDVLIVFISSHGFVYGSRDFRIQPADFAPNMQERSSVSYQKDILNELDVVKCKKLIFLDACYSGAAQSGKASGADIGTAIDNIIKKQAGITTFASSSPNEESHELPSKQNGSFTEALLEGLLKGKADKGKKDGIITLDELANYVTRRVPELNRLEGKPKQTPMRSDDDLGAMELFVY